MPFAVNTRKVRRHINYDGWMLNNKRINNEVMIYTRHQFNCIPNNICAVYNVSVKHGPSWKFVLFFFLIKFTCVISYTNIWYVIKLSRVNHYLSDSNFVKNLRYNINGRCK